MNMLPVRKRLLGKPIVVFLLLLATTVSVVALGRTTPLSRKLCPDYICYWAAGKLLLEAKSPYDPALQTEIQRAAGWDKDRDGLKVYAFLPFYYPPWFAMVCVALVPLGYPLAKLTWLVVNTELLLVTAVLIRTVVPRVPKVIPLLMVPLFVFSWASVVVGQTTVLTLFLIVVAWRLLDLGRDRAAGAVLAFLSFKPQLTAVLLLALVIWSFRRGRFGVIVGLVVAMAALMAASSLILPSWPSEFLNATRVTPPPTEYFPKIGTTWYLLLKVAGSKPPWIWLGYLAVAIPFLAILARSAIDRSRGLGEVISLALLSAYVLMPYGRHYDFPVLLITLFVLLEGRISERLGAVMIVLLILVPYIQYHYFPLMKTWLRITGPYSPEFTFSWIPAMLTAAWVHALVKERASTGHSAVVSEG